MTVNVKTATSSSVDGTANGPNYNCGLPAPLKVTRTEANFGRRFYDCLNYEEPTTNCGFFMWCDGPTPDHLKALLTEYYLEKEMYKQRYHKLLKERDTLLCELSDLERHCQDVGTELIERRKDCRTLEEHVNMGRGFVSRWRQQNLWIAFTCAALLWHLQP